MNRNHPSVMRVFIFALLSWLKISGSSVLAQGPGPRPSLPPIPVKGDTTHTLTKHFTQSSSAPKKPDAKG